ncbi:Binding-protein-dependent transport systems inner membrane component (fragment) (plasmid) [Cupriavidus taiwanensis]|uniref:Binding-protein-dependent transport systems inner membrane component n=1 Tax=Cupriavidus taiwanensis TaxID=164546 RepID=A0A375IQY6_9BURK
MLPYRSTFGGLKGEAVAAEFVSAKSGIGILIWNSWQVFEVEKMQVGLAASAMLGFLVSLGFDLLEWVLLSWCVGARRHERRRP